MEKGENDMMSRSELGEAIKDYIKDNCDDCRDWAKMDSISADISYLAYNIMEELQDEAFKELGDL